MDRARLQIEAGSRPFRRPRRPRTQRSKPAAPG
jgi:hypothetical protein